VINFRPKAKTQVKAKKKTSKSPGRSSGKTSKRDFTPADIAEINLFGEVIAKMNLRADERRRAAKAKA
jgi:hypothetical protein